MAYYDTKTGKRTAEGIKAGKEKGIAEGGSVSALKKQASSRSSSSPNTKDSIMDLQRTLNAKTGSKLVVDGIMGSKTQDALNSYNAGVKSGGGSSSGSSTTTTPKTTISSGNLKVGSTGQAVKDLQMALGITADGIFGPQTDAAVKAYQTKNKLTPDGIVGVNTAARLNNAIPTAPGAQPLDMGVPTVTTPPVLPDQNADITQDSYMTSLNEQLANMQTVIDTQRQDYLAQIQQDKQQAMQDMQDLRNQQADMISDQGRTAIEAKEKKMEEIDKEIARFDEAYRVKQSLTTQLQDMITQGNSLIESQKATTGLTAIRNPRVTETISNLSAAAAVLKIGIDAQDNNMINVQNQLNTAVSAITSAYKDQLDYYTTLNNFYESSVTDEGNKLINLTAAEQDFMTTTIATLQDNIDRVQANADAMQELFMDPSTATAFAKAGITLNTPQSEWGPKLAKQAYSDELSELSKDMAGSGYTALIGGSAPVGADVVKITDSKGNTKTYWKKGDGTGGGATSSIDTYAQAYLDEQIDITSVPQDIRSQVLEKANEIANNEINGVTTPTEEQTTPTRELTQIEKDIEADIEKYRNMRDASGPLFNDIQIRAKLKNKYPVDVIDRSSAGDTLAKIGNSISDFFR